MAAPDHLGPAGFRCGLHGLPCTVTSCTRIPWGRVEVADKYGRAGRRCWIHGGKTCNVPGCLSRPVRHVAESDHHGLAGIRCASHSGNHLASCDGPKKQHKRSVHAGCQPNARSDIRWCQRHVHAGMTQKCQPASVAAMPKVEVQTVQLAEEDRCMYSDGQSWRCGRPRKEGQRVCEYHWAKRTLYEKLRRKVRDQGETTSFGREKPDLPLIGALQEISPPQTPSSQALDRSPKVSILDK